MRTAPTHPAALAVLAEVAALTRSHNAGEVEISLRATDLTDLVAAIVRWNRVAQLVEVPRDSCASREAIYALIVAEPLQHNPDTLAELIGVTRHAVMGHLRTLHSMRRIHRRTNEPIPWARIRPRRVTDTYVPYVPPKRHRSAA